MQHALRPTSAALAALFSIVGLALPARAADYFVDAAAGADVPAGGTVAQPWKTIAYARSLVGGEGVTIHVAPGVYDAALGETFPIPLTGAESIVGAGAGKTFVDGGGTAGDLFVFAVAPGGDTSLARLEGLTLRGAGTGLRFATDLPTGTPRIEGLVFQGLQEGVYLQCSLTTAEPTFAGCTFARCAIGLLLTTTSTNPTPVLSDCRFERCGTGVQVLPWSHPSAGFSTATVRLVHSVIERCDTGVDLGELDAYAIARLEGCLVTGCDVAIRYTGVSDAVLVQSTLAGNTAGLVVPPAPDNDVYTILESSVVWGQAGPSLDPAEGTYFGGHSDTDPEVQGLPGCMSVDPRFVDAAGGDFHLLPGSPVIDRGDPATPTVGTDFDLDPRVIDGDADWVSQVDMGYDEWNPTRLSTPSPPVVGEDLRLVIRAPAGQVFFVALALKPGDLFLGSFGSLLLDITTFVFQTSGLSPGSVTIPIPDDPAVVGVKLHSQALSVELPGPGVGSFSNRLDIVIVAQTRARAGVRTLKQAQTQP